MALNNAYAAQQRQDDIDQALRSYMLRVYNYMCAGIAFTGAVAVYVSEDPVLVEKIAGGDYTWYIFIGILGMGAWAPVILSFGSLVLGHLCFWAYCALWGAWFGPVVYYYTGESVIRVFFITAATFAATSLTGYLCKRNLGPGGAFLSMATWGLLIALFTNIFFLQSESFHLILSLVVILVFAGLTACDTQAIADVFDEIESDEEEERCAVLGAFMLYGNFAVIFSWMMNLLGEES
jgi:FtsH-binding integral membrane protein